MTIPVDGALRPPYTLELRERLRVSRRVVALCALGLGGFGACAPGRAQTVGPVSHAAEREARLATAPDQPVRIVFDWETRERDARFNGRGAARVQSPHHARLDLFGPRGEGVLSAAVVGNELRLPPATSAQEVPPPPLLWSVLGVFLPPPDARLVATAREGDRLRLEYLDGGARWRFEFAGNRLRRAEWIETGGNRHTVELEGQAGLRLPKKAVYRDWAAFTELTLTLDDVEQTEPFPPETWTPGAP